MLVLYLDAQGRTLVTDSFFNLLCSEMGWQIKSPLGVKTNDTHRVVDSIITGHRFFTT